MTVLAIPMAGALLLAGIPVELSLLSGESVSGELVQMDTTRVVVNDGSGEQEIPRSDLLEVSLTAAAEEADAPAAAGEPAAEAVLTDGGVLAFTRFEVANRQLRGTVQGLGELEMPTSQIRGVRLAERDDKVEDAWQELLSRETRQDRLVIRKDDVLDYLDGVIGDINAESISFLLDGDEIPVKRERAFGWIYANRPEAEAKGIRVATAAGSRFQADELTFDGTHWQIGMSGVPQTLSVPAQALESLDFSSGKLMYLSRMEPRDVKYTPYFDIVWQYRRDRHLDGGPISIDNVEYRRGLSIHSRTSLRYRLNGDYRRFIAVAGIDDVVRPRGDLILRIKGDEQVLFEGRIRGSDPPLPLDLDVTGVRDLEIYVDFGENHDFQDHLDLAEARVTK